MLARDLSFPKSQNRDLGHPPGEAGLGSAALAGLIFTTLFINAVNFSKSPSVTSVSGLAETSLTGSRHGFFMALYKRILTICGGRLFCQRTNRQLNVRLEKRQSFACYVPCDDKLGLCPL